MKGPHWWIMIEHLRSRLLTLKTNPFVHFLQKRRSNETQKPKTFESSIRRRKDQRRFYAKVSLKGRQASLLNLALFSSPPLRRRPWKSLSCDDIAVDSRPDWLSLRLTSASKFHHPAQSTQSESNVLFYGFPLSVSFYYFSRLWSFAAYKETNLCVFLPRCWHHLIPPFFWSIITIMRLT